MGGLHVPSFLGGFAVGLVLIAMAIVVYVNRDDR